ncbi:MAG: RNA polymerase sigma factor [bacterium]
MKTTNEPTDKELVAASSKGDMRAFEKLVKRLEPRVAATVISMLGNSPEVDDVGQETFVRFYKALDQYRGDSSVASYVTRIAMNLSLNELKRRKRWFGLFSADDSDLVQAAGAGGNSEATYDDRELVRMALQQLTPEYRAVVVLRIMEGYSTEETANILKIPVGTVTSRLARGQAKLKDIVNVLIGETP